MSTNLPERTSRPQAQSVGVAAALTPDAILQLGLGFWGSKTLLSAVELGVFTHLAQGPLTGKTLVERLGLHGRSAHDFLDALVALGMLEQGGGAYANTPATDLYLDRAKPTYIGGMLEMVNARLFRFWADLTEGLKPASRRTRPSTAATSSTPCTATPSVSSNSFPP